MLKNIIFLCINNHGFVTDEGIRAYLTVIIGSILFLWLPLPKYAFMHSKPYLHEINFVKAMLNMVKVMFYGGCIFIVVNVLITLLFKLINHFEQNNWLS